MLRRLWTRGGARTSVFLALLALSIPAPADAAGVYFVKNGDTLEEISRIFRVSAQQIREVNQLQSSALDEGDRLRIPDPPAPAFEAAAIAPTVAAPAHVAAAAAVAETVRVPEVSSDRVLQAVCRDETVYHTVAKGDTLFSLAGRYGTELDSLLQLNGLRKKSRLSIGQKIVVRKSGPRSHVVRRGETLSRIGARYGVEIDEIARLNHLAGDALSVGQQLLIQPCDPYASAGGAPPRLDAPDDAGLLAGALKAMPGASAATDEEVPEPGLSASAAAMAKRVISLARTMLNVPYRFGGNSLRGIDCSAYVQRVYGLLDVRLPRTAREQFTVGARIGKDDLQIGDLVFFRTYAKFPSHVGIYLGDDLFIHASSMVRRVAIDRLDRPYYRKRFIGARRMVVDSAPAVASTP